MKKLAFKLLAIIGGTSLIILFFLFRTVDSNDKEVTQTKVAEPKMTSSEAKGYFMEGCLKEAGIGYEQYQYCSCLYDYLEEKTGLEGFKTIAEEYSKTDEMPQVFYDGVDYCTQ